MKNVRVIEIDDLPLEAQTHLRDIAPDFRWNGVYKYSPEPFADCKWLFSSDDDFNEAMYNPEEHIKVVWEDGEIFYFKKGEYPLDEWLYKNGFSDNDDWHIDLDF